MNKMYNCIIIDDEPIARRVIKNHLSFFTDFKIEAECSNALEVIPLLSKFQVDLLFCDIQMPQITGLDFIKSLTHPPKVIFTTAHRDYAVDAFELNVVDYLLKPVSLERFAKAINKFLENITTSKDISFTKTNDYGKTQDYIFLKADKKQHKINLDEILWIESLGDYIIVNTQSDKITSKERLSVIAENLPTDKFLRIHRSFIVSIDKINAVGAGFVEIGKKKLPVGRLYKNEISRLVDSKNPDH